jgi:hypothetical protein
MKLLLLMTVAILLNSCANYEPDNPIEQAVEYVIEKETGIDVDLSP